ncbi:MAG: sodium:solute symporter family protein [Bacteroidota bacterium]
MTSSIHPTDIHIFVTFLVITLLVGLWWGRSVKTLEGYALGNKRFSTSTLVATIVATWITGSFLTFRIGSIYKDGIYWIILYLCDVGTLILTGWLLAIRMGPFLQNMSIAEAMGDVYGKPVRVITAIFGMAISIGLVALQLKAGEQVFSILAGWSSVRATIAAGLIIILYSTFGGIRSVTFTDVLQFFTFGSLIPILALIIWNDTRDLDAVSNMLQTTPHFNIKTLLTSATSDKQWSLLTLIPLYLIPAFTPSIFQRATMARNVYQVRKAFLYASLIYFILLLFIIWISILIRTKDANLDPGDIFHYIIDKYASIGMAGFILSGLMAMVMSTADSNLNAAAVIFANDITSKETLNKGKRAGLKISQLTIAKLASVIIGLLALFLALQPNSNLYLKLVLASWGFYMPVVSVPLLLALGGFRSTTRSALIGMTLGFVTVLAWDHLLYHINIDSSMPGMLANLIGILGSHYLLREPGGWQKAAPDSPLALERTARRQAWQRHIRAVKSFQLYAYLQKSLPTQEGFYFFFGLYAISATYASFYTIGNNNIASYEPIYTGIYHTVLPITTIFLTLPIWPPTMRSKRFTAFLWPLGIGATLFFAGTLLVIMSHYHHMQVMIMMINILMAVLLLRWPLALLLAFTGITLAALFLRYYTGLPLPTGELVGSLQLQIMYGLLLFTSFLIVLFKGKQAYKRLSTSYEQLREERAASSAELLEALHHRERLVQEVAADKADAIMAIKDMGEKMNGALKQAETKEQLISINKDFQTTLDKLHVLTEYLAQVTYQTQGYMRLEVKTIPLSELLHEVFEVLNQQDPAFAKQILVQQHTTHQIVQADIGKLKQLLLDSLYYAQQHKQERTPILLSIQDASLGYPITAIQGHVKEVSALRYIITTASTLPKGSSTVYMVSVDRASIRLPKEAAELPITHNQQIVEAHYGTSEFIESTQGITQIYVIPVRVREVRPQTMDLLSTQEITPDTAIYPAEKAFVEDVKRKTKIDDGLLQQALLLIKKYHAGTRRMSGEPFYLHPIAVAHILLDYTQDQDTILAALLHDTVEDTRLTLAQIALSFNAAVKNIVDGVTHLDSNLKNFKSIQLSPHENIQQLLEVKDERVFYVKLADRLHNMRTIGGHTSLNKQKKIAEETLRFFIPMAKRLDIKPIAEELMELCFAVLNRR